MKLSPVSCSYPIILLWAALALAGCGKQPGDAKSGKPPAGALITVTQAQSQTMLVTQKSVGEVESAVAPLIGAEVAGRVTQTLAEAGQAVKKGQVLAELDPQDQAIERQAATAEAARLKALLVNQELTHARDRRLREQNFISQAALDNSEAQLSAVREQYNAAEARLAAASRALGKTRVVAPVAGIIEQRKISAGDYVKVGDPLFKIATSKSLRIVLPFPEGVAPQLRTGLAVRLSTPTAPDKPVNARITELRPMVGSTNRAMEAIIALDNPGGWAPGASVNGDVIVAEHANAVVVPETSVVVRPAGKVVYVIRDGKAGQRVVDTGESRDGVVEIVKGLAAGETVAVDGAGYLTDKAAVTVQGTNK
ncbi:MAG: efflux RND transporter periplasmic adaptor subunit [Pseudomonadota bacterium]|jgi:RND family efflux transporter MFP subunit